MRKTKKFSEAFPTIPLTKPTAGVFNDMAVNSVKLSRDERILRLDMESPFIVSENACLELKSQIKSFMPFINNVELKLRYKTEDRENAIGIFWESLVDIISESNPLCARILRDSDWSLKGGELTLMLNNNGSFIFSKRGLDKKIEDIINERFGFGIFVKCVDSGKKTISKEYKSEILKREQTLVKDAASVLSNAAVKPPVNVENKQNAKPFGFKAEKKFKGGGRNKKTKINNDLKGVITYLSEELIADDDIFVNGRIIKVETREIKSGSLLVIFDITDLTNSVTVKFFTEPETFKTDFADVLKEGGYVAVNGKVKYDSYANEINITAVEIGKCKEPEPRTDLSENKRVELHLHTQMSSMDAVTPVAEYIKRAAKWGHKAIAITDHGVVQAFPDAMNASKKHNIKIIYGVEAYLVDDLGAVVSNSKGQDIQGEFIAFDIETTGLKPELCKIIEIGAVRIKNLQIIEAFNIMCDPEEPIPYNITQLTGIDDEMVKNQPKINEALSEFFKFAGSAPLIAHNASFDAAFISCHAKKCGMSVKNTIVDTLSLSRSLYPDLKNHKLDTVTGFLNISLENHHRASDDAAACGQIFLKSAALLLEKGINNLNKINEFASETLEQKSIKHHHAVILVKDMAGLRNLYELISEAHLKYFYKRPRILKSRFIALREGLIIGTACESGEFYRAIRENADESVIAALAEFYDYFEIQPNGNNMYLVREGFVASENELNEINKKIVLLGEKYNKPVVATCDVHFIDKEDEVFRRMIMYGEGYKDADIQPPLFFRTTDEMLSEFSYLGAEKAREVVINNTIKIADMTEEIKPIPDETFPPEIEGAEEKIKELATKRTKELYGEELPEYVASRLNRELNSIIKNGFSVMYLIAQKLVANSLENGYLVGSRGSVGSSFVATMTGITEVNPLSPHYLCPNCKYSDFDSEIVLSYAGGSGCDMPDKLCPVCGSVLNKDGHDIPFETFLGFDGDKEPDIDLNFSGEFQARAHAYTEELFGEGHVFKAGTIGTLADKNAYGVVKKYLDEKNISVRSAEINRLKDGCVGIKKTTGQHPGGLMIVPEGHSIYEFCPVQRPANDTSSNVVTTHFDYHSISGRLLKLDLLGHDVPTIIRMLHDFTGVDPQGINIGDSDVISLFTSPKKLNVTESEINCKTGSLGLPEFGTAFVRQMLLDTKPQSFAELVRISGLSHGTDVWLNNAQEIIKNGEATLKTIIPSRDDIMLYLIQKGVEKKAAFKIMENVRKGKGLTDSDIDLMQQNDVPEWYIKSCQKIKYLFPKGHAVAYVMMTMRIGYYKIHYPYAFYAAILSVKAEDFDYEMMCFGKEKVLMEINRINSLGKDGVTAKEKNSLTILELVLEMYARGYKFTKLDLYQAKANKFIITDSGLMAPLCSIQGLGGAAAQSVVDARLTGEFLTIEDFRIRTKVNKSVIEILKRVGVLSGMSETNQLSLFD